jgi:hypothetical protein
MIARTCCLLAVALAAPCQPTPAPGSATNAVRSDRIFDTPGELCGGDGGALFEKEATCRGRPVAPALRRYGQAGAVFAAGFVPYVTRAVVGEPVFVAFVLRNDGARPVSLYPPGYRTWATHRSARFQVTAVGPGGAPVPDADGSMELDTIGEAPITLAPGETYVEDLVLPEWAVLDRPGTYTVTATRRTMGWDETATNVEIRSELALEVLPPNPARLAAAVAELGRDLRAHDAGEPWRHRRATERAVGGLIAVDDPAVVPYLAEIVTSTPRHAWAVDVLTGLRRFNVPERRRVAIQALSAPDPYLRREAAQTLGHMPSEETAAALRRALADGDGEVRRIAEQSLRAIGVRMARP